MSFQIMMQYYNHEIISIEMIIHKNMTSIKKNELHRTKSILSPQLRILHLQNTLYSLSKS